MRVLILSCNTGEGHNSCAKALKEVFDGHGEDCVIADGLNFISEKASKIISGGHVFLYKHLPGLFAWGYSFAERHTSLFKESSFLYNFFASGSDGMYEYITQNGYEAVISTHPFTALMLTEMQRRYRLNIKTAFVATDYTCSPCVKDSDLDAYFIPSAKLAGDFECATVTKEKIIASGIPLRQMFYTHTEKEEAKRQLEIPTERKHIVIMCGSMGCGPMDKLVNGLTRGEGVDYDLTVVCGSNKKLKSQLDKKYGERSNLHIRGYVKDMSLMLDSADLYLTKPGGISTTEAALKNVPMLFIDTVAGCEDYNGRFYCELGAAEIGSRAEELIRLAKVLITTEAKEERMKDVLSKQDKCNSSERVRSAIISLCEKAEARSE